MGSQQETGSQPGLGAMGSFGPSTFGYNFDAAFDVYDFDTSTLPTGPPLLNEEEGKKLNFFIDDLTRVSANVKSFDGELQFSETWASPELIGMGVSLGTPGNTNDLVQSFDPNSFYDWFSPPNMMRPLMPSHAGSHRQPEDVVAANTLLRTANPAVLFDTSAPLPMQAPVARHPAHVPQHHPLDFGQRHAPPRDDHYTLHQMGYGSRTTERAPGRPAPPAEVPRFGSDPSFNQPRYQPASWNGSLDAIQGECAAVMGCLTADSAATTRVSSPTIPNSVPERRLSHPGRVPVRAPAAVPPPATVKPEAIPDSESSPQPKKRKYPESAGSESDPPPVPAKVRGRRRSKASPAPSDVPRRGRKSTALSPKSAKHPRENLSDQQKRENHIRSEQKRRNVIREGQESLCNIVPLLRGVNASKAEKLNMTCKWLEDLLGGNERLAAQLEAARAQRTANN